MNTLNPTPQAWIESDVSEEVPMLQGPDKFLFIHCLHQPLGEQCSATTVLGERCSTTTGFGKQSSVITASLVKGSALPPGQLQAFQRPHAQGRLRPLRALPGPCPLFGEHVGRTRSAPGVRQDCCKSDREFTKVHQQCA